MGSDLKENGTLEGYKKLYLKSKRQKVLEIGLKNKFFWLAYAIMVTERTVLRRKTYKCWKTSNLVEIWNNCVGPNNLFNT